VKILQNPSTSIACDCGAVVPGAASHPRYYGSFPRVLGRYVREQRALTLEDAVRKMSGLPAATIGMIDRGLLAVGMAADVAIFDPGTIIDHATFEEPTLPSDGVRFVIVNGQLAVNNGQATPARSGKAVKRLEYMPTRPMNEPGTSRSIKGGSQPREAADHMAMISVDVSQSAKDRRAHGNVWVGDSTYHAVEMFEFGVLQTGDGWWSVTGRGGVRASQEGEQTMILTVDREYVALTPDKGAGEKGQS
jgi:hypothetical protein